MLRIRVLGGLFVERDGRVLAGAAAQPRRLAVLALLARAGQRGVTRDKLLGVLWPDQEEEKGRRALTQALYALRQELGSEEAITGAKDLRLDPSLVASDVGDFTQALAEGRPEEAVSLYEGPFLDGFHLGGAEEFERWVEQERQALAHDFAEALRTLALAAGERGDGDSAVRWWKRLAAHDPLDPRSSLALMRALVAAGDARGALQHARIHELLLQEHLDLPPDREVTALAAEIRAGLEGGEGSKVEGRRSKEGTGSGAERRAAKSEPPPAPPTPALGTGHPADTPARHSPSPGPWAPGSGRVPDVPRPDRPDPLVWAAGVAVIVAAIALVITLGRRAREEPLADPARVSAAAASIRGDSTPVVVVGRINDYSGKDLAAALGDMLGTNLARAPQLCILSTARMYELLRDRRDTSGAAILAAARSAGATELLEGSLYDRGGTLRLDLRRLELATGDVREAWTVEGPDAFALADSATARFIRALGLPALGSLAEVTTSSIDAWRAYEAGLRHFYAGEYGPAEERFTQASLRDPQFAMAQYYYSLTTTDQRVRVQRLARARDLAARASERERLLITAAWAEGNSDPSLRAVAETLTTRYAAELEGWVYLAQALINDGEYVAARDPLHRVLQADTAGIAAGAPNCVGCRALFYLAGTYDFADSILGVTRMGRLWTRLQPEAAAAWRLLAAAYARSERYREAHDALDRSATAQPRDLQPAPEIVRANFLIYEERWDSALATLAALVTRGGPLERAWPRWWRSYVARNLGHFDEALAEAREFRRLMRRGALPGPGEADPEAALVGLALLEAGDPRGSAALFDSVSRYGWPQGGASQRARHRAWNLAHRATALAAAGDTTELRGLVATIREAGRGSGLERDRRLHHYVAGLLWKARGRRDSAIAAFRATLYAPGVSYTRANLELGRALLEDGQAMEAVRVLGPVLRGGLEGPGLYVIRTEIRGLLGEAWLRAGNPDSARVHLRQAAANWAEGEPRAKAESVRWRGLLERMPIR